MHKRSLGHIKAIIWAFCGLVLLGLMLGQLAWVLVIGLLVYLVWTITQAVRMHRWLYHQQTKLPDELDIPQSYGLWGDLFEGIYDLQKQNVKAQNHLKSMINRVQMSMDAMKDAVIMTNANGELEWWNSSADQLLGFRKDTDRGQLISNLIRLPAFKLYFRSKRYQEPFDFNSPINKDIKLRLYVTLFAQDERLVFVQDITRISRLEEMKKDFVTNVSHDLRTPLTVIKGYIETLQDAGDLPAKWQRPLKNMELQAQRMETLIHDLLLLSKYETADVSLIQQPINLWNLLKQVCHDATLYSGERQHVIQLQINDQVIPIEHSDANNRLSEPVYILGDERQLYSAVSNLVFNAVKYTQDKGKICVHWRQTQKSFELSVKDNGVGFDPIHIPHLTERFYRTDPSRDMATGGSGLGLAIVKHVLLNHKASLEIKSKVGAGSEFICHFPLAIMMADSPEKAALKL